MVLTRDLEIKFANENDLQWCLTQDHNLTIEVFYHKIRMNEIIIALVKFQPAGYLRVEYLWLTTPYIGWITVKQEYQRVGIGKSMLHFLEEFVQSKGHKVLYSSSEVMAPSAQEWHRKMHFVECGIIAGINDGGIGEVFFRKPL